MTAQAPLSVAPFLQTPACPSEAPGAVLQTLGGAPMFFYLLHLYALHLAYWLALHAFGTNHGERFGFDAAWQLWAAWLPTVALLYGPTRRFAALRRTGRHPWMRYL
ncbi:hypothetical protein [Ralstonia pseudosolanacearum]|uniref:hypothetical protein n=1 Tax=Ralstonia pseudosolanacearum TaxID=1310165 RepID=UPI00322174C6